MPHVHLLGIGGSGMSGLASLFVQKGWRVTGCDRGAVYPPALHVLEREGIVPILGHDPAHLDPAPDLVVVGNVVRESNPEDRAARALGLRRMHMAEALWHHFIAGRASVVVAGTHGKTTCTSMLAFLLRCSGHDPGYFIGGQPRDLERSAWVGSGPFFVTEGDEYDCAWFHKVPKFLSYRPSFLLVTVVEYDHADIYPSLSAVQDAFRRLVSGLPRDGVLVLAKDAPGAWDLASSSPCRVVSYGREGSGAEWEWGAVRVDETHTTFRLQWRGCDAGEFRVRLMGAHNVANATGVLAMLHALGVDPGSARDALARFQGASRRLQVVGRGRVVVIDDFAHHPTEIAAGVDAVRARWGWPVWVVFEPKTQTNRRNVLQHELASALAKAHHALVLQPHDLEGIPSESRLDVGALVEEVNRRGGEAVVVSHDSVLPTLLGRLEPPAVVVLMSAGSMGPVLEPLLAELVSRGWIDPGGERGGISPG